MGHKPGKLASVRLGTYKVSEMSFWSINGMTNEILEDTEFGDEFKSFMFGVCSGGTLSFTGWFDATDGTAITGQSALMSAYLNKQSLQDFRLYVDNNSYFACQNNNDALGDLLVDAVNIDFDKSGVGKINFQMHMSGRMKETAGTFAHFGERPVWMDDVVWESSEEWWSYA